MRLLLRILTKYIDEGTRLSSLLRKTATELRGFAPIGRLEQWCTGMMGLGEEKPLI
jgi:hypothetical protein